MRSDAGIGDNKVEDVESGVEVPLGGIDGQESEGLWVYVFEQVAGYLAAKKLSFMLLVKDDECGPHSYMAMATASPKRPHLIFFIYLFLLFFVL